MMNWMIPLLYNINTPPYTTIIPSEAKTISHMYKKISLTTIKAFAGERQKKKKKKMFLRRHTQKKSNII